MLIRVVCECVTIYLVLCWVWCKECDWRWYLSPYSRSSWSQSPLTVPASPASCQSSIWRPTKHSHRLSILHLYMISQWALSMILFFLVSSTMVLPGLVVRSLSPLLFSQRKEANYVCLVVRGMSGNMQTMQTIGACVSQDQTPGQSRSDRPRKNQHNFYFYAFDIVNWIIWSLIKWSGKDADKINTKNFHTNSSFEFLDMHETFKNVLKIVLHLKYYYLWRNISCVVR